MGSWGPIFRFFMKLFRKDVLNLKFNSNKSYWIKKVDHKSDMRKQF